MKWFSERVGLKKARTEIQVNSMDKALRNRLWNVFQIYYLRPMTNSIFLNKMRYVMTIFWDRYLKLPIDSAPHSSDEIWNQTQNFFSEIEWQEVCDFLEFLVDYHEDKKNSENFMEICNKVLETELSAYRFVGGKITPITSEVEISEIEEALETPLTPVRAHLKESLRLLSDRKSPNYRNSIKESISAIEAICKLITKDKNAKLGQALDKLEGEIGLHGALKKAFDSLYGYASAAEGIRHSLLDESTLSFEDAKFMLVSCSAFINYLVSKTSKAGLKIG